MLQPVPAPRAESETMIRENGEKVFHFKIFPLRGVWLTFELDASNILWARMDAAKKMPLTLLLRLFEAGSNEQILQTFHFHDAVKKTLETDASQTVEEDWLSFLKYASPRIEPSVEEAKKKFFSIFFSNGFGLSAPVRSQLNQLHASLAKPSPPSQSDLLSKEDFIAVAKRLILMQEQDAILSVYSNGRIEEEVEALQAETDSLLEKLFAAHAQNEKDALVESLLLKQSKIADLNA